MKSSKFILALALVVAALGGVVYGLLGRRDAVDEDASKKASAIPVATSAVRASSSVTLGLPAASSTNQMPTVRGTLPYVLTSRVTVDSSVRQAVEAMGAKIVEVLSRQEVLIEVDESVRARLLSDGRFEAVTECSPDGKIQPELSALIASGAATVEVSLLALSNEDRARVIARLEQGGGEMLTGCINEGCSIRARVPSALVAELALCGDVRWMEKFERPHLMNDLAVTEPLMNVREVWDSHGLTGFGQCISTSDTGIDTGSTNTLHRDLRNRVKDIKVVDGCSTNDVNGHGTHTAGSIVGDGTESNGLIRGTAHGADLYAWFCCAEDGSISLPTTTAALFTNEGSWNTFIHSASWGMNVNGQYILDCYLYDEYVWKHPEFLPVFSAGNEGSGSCTIGAPASAKNVLTVGATQSTRKGHDGGWGNGDPKEAAVFSSRGPCKDGRIKPDISAPGVGILSTRSHGVSYSYGIYDEFYAYDSGTSMSCPLTAGAVALVRQWLIEKKGFSDEEGKRPTSALMKAVIMGGAKRNEGMTKPTFEQGWGRVDLANTLFPEDGRDVFLVDRIPFKQGFVTNIVIETTNAAPLDVQLVWVDAPGSIIAAQDKPRLINDLDLTVRARVKNEPLLRYGNGWDEPDSLNNAESVHILEAKPTTYAITVDCKNITCPYFEKGEIHGAAALYIRGAFNSAEVSSKMPAYVHLKRQDRDFMSLDTALKAVNTDDETVEILDWVNLEESVTLTNRCTILATNAHASASRVERAWKNASVIAATNACVTITNVSFSTAATTPFLVEKGGKLIVRDGVDFGVGYDNDDSGIAAIKTVDANGFELAGVLKNHILFKCQEAKSIGMSFGCYSCPFSVASNTAAKIVCIDDEDRETRGEAVEDDKILKWASIPVPMNQTVAYYVDDAGTTNTFAKMKKAFKNFKDGYDKKSFFEFVVRTNGEFGVSFNVVTNLTIRGEGASAPILDATSTSGFVVPSSILTLSNVVFRGYTAPVNKSVGFIDVTGGALTLEKGAELDGITGRVKRGSGVIDLDKGVVTMKKGSAIRNCAARGQSANGGAIYVESYDCTLNLLGGTITNCYAESYGGGVFLSEWGQNTSVVNLAGPLSIAGNYTKNSPHDDINLATTNSLPRVRVTDNIKGWVGLRYRTRLKSDTRIMGNADGDAFLTNAVEGALSNATLRAFFCDTDDALRATTNAVGRFVWEQFIDDGTCLEEDASVCCYVLDDAGGITATNYYANLPRAFAFIAPGTTSRIEMRTIAHESKTIDGIWKMPADCRITLTQKPGDDYVFTRGGSGCIYVPAGSSLTVTNLVLAAGADEATGPYLDVDGGLLTLAAGARVSSGRGDLSRDANGITVHNGGCFTLLAGAEISGCTNVYNLSKTTPKAYSQYYGVGGGVLVDDGATAYLRGGVITNCCATRGGGVCVCNNAKVYVSDDVKLFGNSWLRYGGGIGGKSNLLVEDLCDLNLSGALTNAVVGTGGGIVYAGDSNLVAKVSYVWTNDVPALVHSASLFIHDGTSDVGVAVTNGTTALILWRGALDENNSYTSGGVTYVRATNGTETAFTSSSMQPKLTTMSTLLGATENLSEPLIEISNLTPVEDGFKVTVRVTEGDTPVVVDPERVKNLFQATSDIGDWSKTVELTISDGEVNADNSVTYHVTPAGKSGGVFIRLTTTKH